MAKEVLAVLEDHFLEVVLLIATFGVIITSGSQWKNNIAKFIFICVFLGTLISYVLMYFIDNI